MLPKLDRKRALFVLAKIDEILAWEQSNEAEKDTKFVELGRYLCEVRAGQYWRLEKLKSFDEFLTRRFPESRRKAYYLMSIHEHLPLQARRELKEVGWTKGLELAKVARRAHAISNQSQRSWRTGYPACARYDGRLQHRLFSRENRRQKKFRSCARPPLAITAYSIARNSPPATYIFRFSDAASLLLTATASSIVAAI